MSAYIFAIAFLAAMFVIPWLFKKFTKPPNEPEETGAVKDRLQRKRHSNSRYRRLGNENDFSEFDPNRNDESEWINQIEPKFRNASHLPPDWERRRILTYFKDKGKCGKCRRPCGHAACDPEQVWNFKPEAHLLYDADVHHRRCRFSGGDHSLENLVLYCLRCHSEEHPDNDGLWARRFQQALGGGNVKNCYRRKAPKKNDIDVPF
jgi:hypothetical protein